MFSKKNSKTKIIVQFDAGLPNSLYIRGEGIPDLNWNKGVQIKNTKSNEWEFETDKNFTKGEFKILINDATFEEGENHVIYPGSSMRINPKF